MKMHVHLLMCAAVVLGCSRNRAGSPTPGSAASPSLRHVKWIQVDTDSEGRIAKCSVYHDDGDDVPGAVKQLAERKFPGAAARYFENELYPDLGRVYEVEVETREGRHCEVAGKADGTELYTECELDPRQVPSKVRHAVQTLLPSGELREAEAKQGPAVDEIDLEVLVDDELHYLRFKASGRLIQHLVRMRGKVAP